MVVHRSAAAQTVVAVPSIRRSDVAPHVIVATLFAVAQAAASWVVLMVSIVVAESATVLSVVEEGCAS